jgi:hypothetical protein
MVAAYTPQTRLRRSGGHEEVQVMRLRLEADPLSCGKPDPCPKIWGVDGDEEWVFVQGKLPTAEERALFHLPEDEAVVKYPRASMRTWAADQPLARDR